MTPHDLESAMGEQLVKPHDVAELLGVAEATLACWRRENRGPRHVRLEGHPGKIRYRAGDIREWIASRVVDSTADAA